MKLDLKDLVLYGLCIPAGLFSIYEGTNLIGYVNKLKEQNPECYATNPNRLELFFGTIFALAVASFPI